MPEGYREYSDSSKVYTIAVPESMGLIVQDPARYEGEKSEIDFSWLVLAGDGLAVKINCYRLQDWHQYVTYTQERTLQEYSQEALLMSAERINQRFPDNATSVMQWSKNFYQQEIPGGFMTIRLATWWGNNPVPHSLTCFTAASPEWIVMGTIEEEVPTMTGAIMKSFTFLPPPRSDRWD